MNCSGTPVTGKPSAINAIPNSLVGTMAASEISARPNKVRWTSERVLLLLQAASQDGVCSYKAAYQHYSSLPTIARRLFGSFAAACRVAGLISASDARPQYALCTVPDCGLQARSSGIPFCEKHYMRMRRYGRIGKHQVPEICTHSSGYLLVYAPQHPLSQRHSTNREYQHRIVYYDHNGEGPFRCHWCGKAVRWDDMHVDHVNWIKDDNRIANLVAACPKCNTWRDKERNLTALRAKIGRHIRFNGERRCVSEWARLIGITPSALRERLINGWTVERALTTPRSKTGPLSD
jgi:hypothetical protein